MFDVEIEIGLNRASIARLRPAGLFDFNTHHADFHTLEILSNHLNVKFVIVLKFEAILQANPIVQQLLVAQNDELEILLLLIFIM